MKILHISDCHGDMDHFIQACLNQSDIVVSSGDFLPNMLPNGTLSKTGKSREENIEDDSNYQFRFIKSNRDRIISLLNNRPLVYIQGNHDWINLNGLHYPKLYELKQSSLYIKSKTKSKTKSKSNHEFYKLYGFPNTPDNRHWNHYTERKKLTRIINEIPDDTNILITHSPPKGILDLTIDNTLAGIEDLHNKITQTDIKLHLFGHIHESCYMTTINDVIYSNAARTYRVIDIN